MSATIIPVDFRRTTETHTVGVRRTASLAEACRILTAPEVRQTMVTLTEGTTELQRLSALLKVQAEQTVQMIQKAADVIRASDLHGLMAEARKMVAQG